MASFSTNLPGSATVDGGQIDSGASDGQHERGEMMKIEHRSTHLDNENMPRKDNTGSLRALLLAPKYYR